MNIIDEIRDDIITLYDRAKAVKDATNDGYAESFARSVERTADTARTLGVALDDRIKEIQQPLPKLVLHWDMAANTGSPGNPNDHTRNSSWGVWQNGWQRFLDEQVWPKVEKYPDAAIMLHNPMGRAFYGFPSYAMEFFQYEAAQGTPLVDGFVEAFEPLCKKHQVIFYLGAPTAMKKWKELLDTDDESAISRGREATAVFEDLGADLAIDALTIAPQDEGLWRHIIKPLQDRQYARGRRVWLEPRPGLGQDHLYDWPIVARLSDWKKQGQPPAWAPDDVLSGPKLLLWFHSGYGRTASEIDRFINDVQDMGSEFIPAILGAAA